MTLAKRIKQALAEAGISKSVLAARIGVSPSAITQWASGETKTLDGQNLISAARVLGVSPEWLATGKGDKAASPQGVYNVRPGPELRGRVPVISWTTAGKWADAQDPYIPGEAEEWLVTTANVGPHAFALRVMGDSMEPRIPDGSIVIIDPDRQYRHGSIVLAKRTNDEQVMLKQLWYDGALPKLRPLNDRYPILDMPADTRIIGVAVQITLDL